MFHNEFPLQIDHIDGNPLNNKIENLRKATQSQNNWNTGIRKNNTSGIKGVTWCKQYKKWLAQCLVNNKHYFLGRFSDIEEAKNKLIAFRQTHHKEFARHV